MAIFIIAEIGINHNGDIEIAKELINAAKICGCDAVKFQKEILMRFTQKNFSLHQEKVRGGKLSGIKK